jgi:two-component system LytT family response regulator
MTIRALIVDDEPLAREGLREFLGAEDGVTIVGECRNGREAVSAIRDRDPDVVFLDVQMPGLDGFGVIDALGTHPTPVVVFVTAYDEYALQAFEIHALDYLLKPVERSRFQSTMQRVRRHLAREEQSDLTERLAAVLHELRARQREVDRLVVNAGGRGYLVGVDEIDWIEAAGNYARLHVGGKRHVIRKTMKALEQELPARQFVRIHRSTIVNLDRVKELQPYFTGEYVVTLQDGTRLSLSRKYRQQLERRLGQRL